MFSALRKGAWQRRGSYPHRSVRREATVLCALWATMGIGAYVQGYGIDILPTADSAFVESSWRTPIPICGIGRRITCLVDGDTGWEDGRKWRLRNIDTPELSNPGCSAEYGVALRARDRLAALMGEGYRVVWSGRTDRYDRALVDVELANGSRADQVLLTEGLAQPWPNTGNVWCDR
jgi:endonuclease YncB( thermonuclease family)